MSLHLFGIPSAASPVDIGDVIHYAGDSEPEHFNFLDGTLFSRSEKADLFAIIGDTYDVGDGSTTFGVPNVIDKFIIIAGDTYSLGNTGGANTVTLDTTTSGGHTHTSHKGNTASVASGSAYITARHLNGGTSYTGYYGSGAAHQNMHPYMGFHSLIRID